MLVTAAYLYFEVEAITQPTYFEADTGTLFFLNKQKILPSHFYTVVYFLDFDIIDSYFIVSFINIMSTV